jgi:hypothetical protein
VFELGPTFELAQAGWALKSAPLPAGVHLVNSRALEQKHVVIVGALLCSNCAWTMT